MTNALRYCISSIAAMVGILVLGIAVPARADLEIQYSTTGVSGSYTTAVDTQSNDGPAIYSGALGSNFSVTVISGASNSPGSNEATLGANQLFLTNTSGTTQTIWLTVGAQGFTAPTAPPTISLQSGIGGADIQGSGGMLKYQSFLDSNNGQNSLTGVTEGQQSVAIGPSFSTSLTVPVTSLTGPFSMTELITVTLTAGEKVAMGSTTSLLPVPELSSMSIAGLGALGLIGYGLRRRKALGA